MFRISSSRIPAGTHRGHRPGPFALAAGLIGMIALAVIAFVTLGIALTFMRRSSRKAKPPGDPSMPGPGRAGAVNPPTPQEPIPRRDSSYAEVIEAWPIVVAAALSLAVAGALVPAAEAKILVPMDDHQTDHLKAYGLTYWALQQGMKADWLLNYRGGSFLFQ